MRKGLGHEAFAPLNLEFPTSAGRKVVGIYAFHDGIKILLKHK